MYLFSYKGVEATVKFPQIVNILEVLISQWSVDRRGRWKKPLALPHFCRIFHTVSLLVASLEISTFGPPRSQHVEDPASFDGDGYHLSALTPKRDGLVREGLGPWSPPKSPKLHVFWFFFSFPYTSPTWAPDVSLTCQDDHPILGEGSEIATVLNVWASMHRRITGSHFHMNGAGKAIFATRALHLLLSFLFPFFFLKKKLIIIIVIYENWNYLFFKIFSWN